MGEDRRSTAPLGARRRVLVVRRRFLGDVVLLGAALQSLRTAWPDAHLAVLTGAAYAGVVDLCADVDEVLPLRPGIAGYLRAAFAVRRARFSHVLDFDVRPRTAWIVRVSAAPVRLGLQRGGAAALRRAYTAIEPVDAGFVATHHATEVDARLLRAAGVPPLAAPPHLTPRPADVAAMAALLDREAPRGARPRVLVHPGSRSPWRLWPAEAFAWTCDRLVAEGLASVTFVAGPGEAPLVEAIRARMRQPSGFVREASSVERLAALLAVADLLLCHDSGPMHLAAAVGTRVVALFGSQGVELWRPLGEGHVALAPPLPCRSCVAPGRCRPENAYANLCVQNVAPERVVEALRGQLRRARSA